MFKSNEPIQAGSVIDKTLRLRKAQTEQQEKLCEALKELKDETGAECLRELEFHLIRHEPSNFNDDIFHTIPQCHSSTCIAGREIDMQEGHPGFLKNLVKLRVMNALQEMIDLLRYDLQKFKQTYCEHKNLEEDGYCHLCESYSEER